MAQTAEDLSPRLAEKRRRILDSARTVFQKKGYVKTTIQDVARAARVGKGTIYEYFDSKEELFLGVCLRVMEEDQERIAELLETGEPLGIGELIEILVSLIPRHSKDIQLFMELWVHVATDPSMREACIQSFRNFYDEMFAGLDEAIQCGVEEGRFRECDPRRISTLCVALVDGLYYQGLFLRSPESIAEEAPAVAQLLLDGLRARNPGGAT